MSLFNNPLLSSTLDMFSVYGQVGIKRVHDSGGQGNCPLHPSTKPTAMYYCNQQPAPSLSETSCFLRVQESHRKFHLLIQTRHING